MTGVAELFLLFKRDFWALFGAIWLLVGLIFVVIGSGLAASDGFYIPLAGGVAITAAGGMILRPALGRIGLELYLRREGLPLEGEVIAVEETSVRYNRRLQWKIRYRYLDRHGAWHQGSSGHLDPDEVAAWRVGDTALVRVDPAHPARSIWIGRRGDL